MTLDIRLIIQNSCRYQVNSHLQDLMKALKKLLNGILPSTEPKEQKPGTVYAVTGGKYLGEFFVFIEKVKGSYMFLSLPSMERRSVPYEKFQIGIDQKIMDKIEDLPADVYSVCEAQYRKNNKST